MCTCYNINIHFWLRLTILCIKCLFVFLILLYKARQSEIIRDPGIIYSITTTITIFVNTVAVDLSLTMKIKLYRVAWKTAPKIYCCSGSLPTLFFLFMNTDLSIKLGLPKTLGEEEFLHTSHK